MFLSDGTLISISLQVEFTESLTIITMYYYYLLLFFKVSGTQGIKSHVTSRAHQTSHLCPREQIEWKKK